MSRRMRRFDRTTVLREIFGWRYIRQNAETALWVFLSPFSGAWWAAGKVYPLFDPFYGGSRYVFGEDGRKLRERLKRAFAASGTLLRENTEECSRAKPSGPTGEAGTP